MKAMILAAGLGTRLSPLTDELPKPLLPIANRPQIEFVLELLLRAGVSDVVINLHHLGDLIRTTLGSSYRGELRIDYAYEKDILGTGGGLKNVENFFDEDPFLLINSDALIELDLLEAVSFHTARKAAATMVVRSWDEGGGYGRVEADRDGRIRRILGRGSGENLTPVIFTGLHILSRRIFHYIPGGVYSCINRDCYSAMLESGERVYGYKSAGYWRDVGTIKSYFETNMDFLYGRMPGYCKKFISRPGEDAHRAGFPEAVFAEPVFIGEFCRIGSRSRLGPAVALGTGSRVGSQCSLERVIALPHSSFTDGESVRDSIRSERHSIPVTGTTSR
ncbi:MAG: NDP-sugar synthase [Candidatus Aureabacteria bacterium]|nr:NDP-sugar synthase [Candidatus Auribacterota bacterium]